MFSLISVHFWEEPFSLRLWFFSVSLSLSVSLLLCLSPSLCLSSLFLSVSPCGSCLFVCRSLYISRYVSLCLSISISISSLCFCNLKEGKIKENHKLTNVRNISLWVSTNDIIFKIRLKYSPPNNILHLLNISLT